MPEEQESESEPVVVEELEAHTEVAPEEQPKQESNINIDELPDNIQEYIHELREESKDRRKTYEPYKEAFKEYNDAEKDYLLQLVTTLSTDSTTGATAMKQLAEHLLGEVPEEETMEVPTNEAEESELIATSEVSDIVQEALQKEKMIQSVHAESRALGFEPDTPACKVLWDLALTPSINGDLVKAAELARAYLGDDAPLNPMAPQVEKEPTLFPSSTAVSGSGIVTADIDAAEIPTVRSDAMRDKVLARLNSQAGE